MIACTLMLAMGSFANAQVVDKTKDKAEQKTERRVDQKIDGGIEKGLDAIEGLFKKKEKKEKKEATPQQEQSMEATVQETDDVEANQNAMMRMLMGGGDVDVQDAYTFRHRFTLNVKTYKRDKLKEDENITMLLDADGGNFGMEVDNEGVTQYIIYDLESREIVTLIHAEGQKMGMTMKLDPSMWDSDEVDDPGKPVTFKKTGNSKEISGYRCDEYLVEGGDLEANERATMWMTDKLEADWLKAMMKMSSQNKKIKGPEGFPSGYPDGTVIQAVNEDTKSGEKTVTTVEKMETGKFDISTEGYQFMSMGSFGGQ